MSATASVGFAPLARCDARVLILGSLPGVRSLQHRQYYAHPQNAFWKIMRDVAGADGSYEQRCDALLEHHIALWDVLAQSVRAGSMDANIDIKSAWANDFVGFFTKHTRIDKIYFNGQKAAQLFRRLVVIDGQANAPSFVTLPSTSPAYASMSYARKLDIWRAALIQN